MCSRKGLPLVGNDHALFMSFGRVPELREGIGLGAAVHMLAPNPLEDDGTLPASVAAQDDVALAVVALAAR
jgi:hypothetical protein